MAQANLQIRKENLSAAKRALLEKRLRGEMKSDRVDTIPQRPEDIPAPLSFAQQRIWFMAQIDPDSVAYNMYNVIHLNGPLQVAALEQSFNAVVDRHPSLRTIFPTVDGQPTPQVTATLKLTIPLIEVAASTDEDLLQQQIVNEARRPFDLKQGPLVRMTLFRCDATRHVLLFNVHHIIFDEWSNEIFWREISAYYQAFLNGEPVALPTPALDYPDFAHWQRQKLADGGMDEQLAYWRQQLAGETPLLQLPTDFPRPPQQTFEGQLRSRTLSPELSAALKALSLKSETTMFMTLLTAFTVLLHRYSGQADIFIGMPITNRNRPEIKEIIGLFLNTLVLRLRLEQNLTFLDLLNQARRVALDAYAHQDLPFEKLVEALHPQRDPSYNPLFQVMVVHQKDAAEQLTLPDLTVQRDYIDGGVAKFDLTLFINETEDTLATAIEYNTALFRADTIERMLDCLQVLLEGVVADPDRPIARLPLLPDAERQKIVVAWNDTQTDYPPVANIHQLIEAQVEPHGDTVAVQFGEQSLTYRDLDRRANQLAHYLRAQGVGPGTLVGICVERSPEMAVAFLGVLKAGGAYVPIDPNYPPDRVAFVLSDTKMPILLTQDHLKSRLPQNVAHLISLDGDWSQVADCHDHRPETLVTPDDLAYVIYTSGSTGQPKGVQITHRNLIHSTQARLDYYPEPVSRFLLLSSFAFDSSVVGLYGTLAQGGTLVLPPSRAEQDVQLLADLIADQQISHFLALPSLYNLILTYAKADRLSSLQAVIVAGEACPKPLVAQHYQQLPRTTLYNEYGPTEGTVWSTVYKIPADEPRSQVPIGRPIPNMRAYILDSQQQPTPIGVPGELYIGGAGVAQGYLNRPALTAHRFIDHPLAGQPPLRLYRTGDLARFLPDGNIQFLGRVDHQVKIRGFRIEMGEIEAALRQHPAVQQAVVMVHTPATQPDSATKRLVAYVETMNGQAVPAAELRRFLLDKLPDYMVPAAFVLLEALPLTPNGKIDRQQLPAPDLDLTSETTFVAPRTPVEETLANIWASALGVESVGVQDNFFELGGDSILSIQIMAKAAQQNIKLKPNDIFQHPTVAALAGVATVGSADIEAQQTAVTGPVPLTPIQQWLFEQDLTAPHYWNRSYLLELAPDVDLTLIERSLQQLFLHHDALRMKFGRTEAGWLQENGGPEQPMRVVRFDFSDLPAAEQKTALEASATTMQQSLDLANGALAQAAIFERGPGQTARLLLVIHHLVVDGVSWQILLEDLESAYQQLRRGEPVRLPPKTSSFQQWAERLTAFAQLPDLEEDLAFWQAPDLGGDPALLPDDPAGLDHNMAGSTATISVALPPEETTALLQQVPAAYQTQINDALLTALLLTFAEQRGAQSLYFDLEGHGREALFEEIDLYRTVGWFTSVFPVQLRLPEETGVGAALISVKEQLRRIPRKGLSYGLLRYLSEDRAVREALAGQPQPQITFNYLGQFDHKLSGYDLFRAAPESGGPERHPDDKRRYLLDINALTERGQLIVKWSYSQNCFRPETMQNLADGFIQKLQAIIDHCTRPDVGGYTPSDFPLVSLNQTQLDELALAVAKNSQAAGLSNGTKNIEAIYPLSPMQQMMLLHTLSQPESDVLFTQMRYTLGGKIEAEILQKAWQQTVNRHPALRTAFVWQETDTPLQVVWQQARLDFEQVDLQHLSPAEQQAELTAILDADRAKGFSPTQPPLMRLTLVRLAADVAELIWSSHHLVMDRWCIAILLREMFSYYNNALSGEPVVQAEPVRPFAGYIEWLQQQDEREAETFWRQRLAGFRQPTLLVRSGRFTPPKTPQTLKLTVPQQTIQPLQMTIRQHHLTMNTVAQGIWALLLSRHCHSDDILFGAAVSGRPADIPGIESMVGSFINNLPVRAKIDRAQSVGDWLHSLQTQQLVTQPYEYVAPAKLHTWSDLPQQTALFDTLLIFQAPITGQTNGSDPMEITAVTGELSTIYPCTLSVFDDGDQLRLWATYNPAQVDEPAAEQLLTQVRHLFETIATNIDRPVGELLDGINLDLRLPEPAQPATDSRREIIGPRDNLEMQLVQIWEALLNIRPISVRDNFFELGGDSLSTIQLIAHIKKVVGAELPLTTLFQAPTIERLAEVIRQGSAAPTVSLVSMQVEGTKPPFFCIPGNLGNVFTDLGYLARHFDPDRPFYAFQDGVQNPAKIEALAAHYIDEIKTVQPSGPYFLGGICSGGTVAFEMARQLQGQGEEVAFVGLIEPADPRQAAGPRTYLDFVLDIGQRFVKRAGHQTRQVMQQASPGEQGSYLKLKAKLLANLWAIFRYKPDVYRGRIDLFITEESLKIDNNPQLEWRDFVESRTAHVHPIPGNHSAITGTGDIEIEESYMEALAKKLKRRIDENFS